MNNIMDSISERAEENHCDSKMSSLTMASSKAFSNQKNPVIAAQNLTKQMSEVNDIKGS